MGTKFTEGEWLVEQCDLPITESEYFNINAVSGGCIADTYNKHDALLIAAAPDMYELLNDILKNYENDTHMDNQINVVLSKARGQS